MASSVARSFCPGSRAAVDKTMEETFMHHAKYDRMGTSISGIYMNYGNYECLICSANAMMYDDASSKTYKDTKRQQN